MGKEGRETNIFWKAGTKALINVNPVLRFSFCHGKYLNRNKCFGKKLPLRPGLDGKNSAATCTET